jgi:uncharacterized membrane protein HdeD (DUF308 family)
MDPDVSRPGLLGRRMLQQQAARWWWTPLVAAFIWFIIAWLVLRANYTSLATVGVLVGVVFLIAAANEGALAAVMGGGWAVLHIVLAVFFVLGAVWAFVRPVNTFFALASVLGLLLLLQGALTLVRGLALRDETPHWWLEAVIGGLLLLLGLWVSTSDRVWNLAGRAVFILLWVGLMALFRGVSDIMLAFSLRRFGVAGEARRPAAAVAGPAPSIPVQERREPARDTAAEEAPRP